MLVLLVAAALRDELPAVRLGWRMSSRNFITVYRAAPGGGMPRDPSRTEPPRRQGVTGEDHRRRTRAPERNRQHARRTGSRDEIRALSAGDYAVGADTLVERKRVLDLHGSCHVEGHRVGVGVNLHDGDLGVVFAGVLVERDQPWFVRLDEVDEVWDALLFVLELPGFEPVDGDEDEWTCHGASIRFDCARGAEPGSSGVSQIAPIAVSVVTHDDVGDARDMWDHATRLPVGALPTEPSHEPHTEGQPRGERSTA